MNQVRPAASNKPIEVAVFAGCLLALGVPFWRIPYESLNVPDAFYSPGLLALAVAPMLLVRFAGAGFLRSLLIPALVPAAALMLRVSAEALQDPTRHNLWPLALVIVVILGLVVASPGALLARLLYR